MASYLDKTQMNTAITDNTKLDLGHQHITTADFMQLNVSMIHEMVPGEKIDVAMESFARLNPLPVPTFGRAALRNRAFFVPFRTIFRGWNDFITDNVHVPSDGYSGSAAILSTCPYVDMKDLCDAFLNSVVTSMDGNGLIMAALPGATSFDFQTGPSNNLSLWNYTIKGRQAVKVLESLGYKLDFDAKAGEFIVSAMPLLALAKIYCDWYFPQQYSNISSYDHLLSLCNLDVAYGPVQLTSTHVALILTVCSFVQYDSDYFVSAWDVPNQPSAGNHSDFKLVNIDSVSNVYSLSLNTYGENGYVTNNSSNASVTNRIGKADAPFITPLVSDNGSNPKPMETPISQYLLHGLHALTDYMKRHQLAGSRAFDRYLARFGKALPAEKMNRSMYLGAAVQDVQIGDVMSTADTVGSSTGAQLGAFAGKGISYGNGHFDCSTDEFGYFIILSSIVPATGYFQGIDRQVMRTTKLQFWTPEFDSLGVQPITSDELYIPQGTAVMTSGNPHTQIFGFTPRYADYKVAHDQLTGNFRLGSINSGFGGLTPNASSSWHLMRDFTYSDFSQDWSNVVHSPDFISGLGDFSQYKRIFYNISPDAPDNFTVIHNFEIAAYAPMKPLYDTYEFEDKGKKVTLDVNGVKMN